MYTTIFLTIMQFCFNVMAIVFKAISKNCFAGDLCNFLETYRGASLQCIADYATPKEIERLQQKT